MPDAAPIPTLGKSHGVGAAQEAGIQAIIITQFTRTRATARPLVVALGITPEIVPDTGPRHRSPTRQRGGGCHSEEPRWPDRARSRPRSHHSHDHARSASHRRYHGFARTSTIRSFSSRSRPRTLCESSAHVMAQPCHLTQHAARRESPSASVDARRRAAIPMPTK